MTQSAKTEARDESRHRLDYYYRPGMTLRTAPEGVVASPLWDRVRQMQFSAWIPVRDVPKQTPIVQMAADHFWQGDEQMDALVASWRATGVAAGRAQFETALVEGIDAVAESSAELVALFEHIDNPPEWFDPAVWERGRQVSINVSTAGLLGMFSHDVLMTLVSHHVSTSTGATGRFRHDLRDRLLETAAWFSDVTMPNGWQRTSPVFAQVIRLRLMHAQARAGCRRTWGPETYERYGDPIPASTMAAAMISFGMTAALVDHNHGRTISQADLSAILMYWGYLGHLLGVPAELIPSSVPEALELVDYIYATGGGPTHGTESMTEAIGAPKPDANRMREFARARLGNLAAGPVLGMFGYYAGEPLTRAMVRATPYAEIRFGWWSQAVGLIVAANVRAAMVSDRLPGAQARLLRRTQKGDPREALLVKLLTQRAAKAGANTQVTFTAHDNTVNTPIGCPMR